VTREIHRPCRQRVEIGRADDTVAVETGRIKALLIREDQQHVETLACLGCGLIV
jgi:hypothetical protein